MRMKLTPNVDIGEPSLVQPDPPMFGTWESKEEWAVQATQEILSGQDMRYAGASYWLCTLDSRLGEDVPEITLGMLVDSYLHDDHYDDATELFEKIITGGASGQALIDNFGCYAYEQILGLSDTAKENMGKYSDY